MQAVAGEVLGPRPGIAICSFWQGRVEIFLRIVAPLIGSLPALVSAAVALPDADVAVGSIVNNTPESLETQVQGTCGYVIAFTGLAILLHVLVVVLRFCNIGLINLKSKVFLTIVVIFGVFFILGHVAGGVVSTFYATEVSGPDDVQNGLIAAAVFCYVSIILYGFAVIWDIIFIAKDWNDKVVKYTLKEAITG